MTSIPPLLALIACKKVRARRAPKDRPKEIDLHMAVARMLRQHCRPEWQWTHIPAGEIRDIRAASKLKAMGTKAGWPDIVLTPPGGHIHSLQLKRIGEDLSEAQEEFRLHCIRYGWPHAVAFTIDEALALLDDGVA